MFSFIIIFLACSSCAFIGWKCGKSDSRAKTLEVWRYWQKRYDAENDPNKIDCIALRMEGIEETRDVL